MATLDLHGHLTAAMVKSADVLVGYKTYPHVDGAARLGRIVALDYGSSFWSSTLYKIR